VSHQQFADDTQLFIAVQPSTASTCVSRLEECLTEVHQWFAFNGLALNADKSDCIAFSSQQRARTFQPPNAINVSSSVVPLSSCIKTLGVHIDSNLTFNIHVRALTKSCFYHIKALRHIRPCLDIGTAKSVACALVSSRLDYANGVLVGISSSNIAKLQRIQNVTAKVVLGSASQGLSSADCLRQLHWLPIRSRIDFKIATLTHKTLQSGAPSYLASMLAPYAPVRALRSSDQNLLVVPRNRTNLGSRAFSCAAPRLWNALPLELRSLTSTTSFRAHLKTHLFSNTN